MAPEEGPPPPSGRTFDTARVVAHAQGKCPGIPTHEGGYSGCRGGADCPVCEGRPIPAPEAPRAIVERVVEWVHNEARRIAEQLAAAKVAEAQGVAALAGRQAEQLREVGREIGRVLTVAHDTLRPCENAGCEHLAMRLLEWEVDSACFCDSCAADIEAEAKDNNDATMEAVDLSYAPNLRRLLDLTREGT